MAGSSGIYRIRARFGLHTELAPIGIAATPPADRAEQSTKRPKLQLICLIGINYLIHVRARSFSGKRVLSRAASLRDPSGFF